MNKGMTSRKTTLFSLVEKKIVAANWIGIGIGSGERVKGRRQRVRKGTNTNNKWRSGEWEFWVMEGLWKESFRR